MNKPIPNHVFDALRKRGLYVTPPFPATHVLAHAVDVAKPKSLAGNRITSYELTCGDLLVDAPLVTLIHSDDGWSVTAHSYFKNFWNSEDDAVADIFDFFFGDPSRMGPRAAVYGQSDDAESRVSEV